MSNERTASERTNYFKITDAQHGDEAVVEAAGFGKDGEVMLEVGSAGDATTGYYVFLTQRQARVLARRILKAADKAHRLAVAKGKR